MDQAQHRALMTITSIERFMSTSERYLLGPDEAERIPRAARLLVKEFTDAVAQGPEALISTPETMRDQQATLATIFWRMLDDDSTLLVDLLVELKDGTREDIVEYLANSYAAWVLASYDVKAFK
jgi:hypothetical protein